MLVEGHTLGRYNELMIALLTDSLTWFWLLTVQLFTNWVVSDGIWQYSGPSFLQG